jgi:DNA-binding GntR family transcriptional regulator
MTSTSRASQSLVDIAYATLAQRIVLMDYAPRERLEEKQLMADLAVKHDCSRDIENMKEANQDMERDVKHNHLQALTRVRTKIKRLAFLSSSQDIDPDNALHTQYLSVLGERTAMIDALLTRDAGQLNELLKTHIHAFQHRILRSMLS